MIRRTLTSLFFLSLVVLFFLPAILSNRAVQERLVAAINGSIPGSVSIEHVDLSWWGRQHLRGVVLRDADDREVASVADAVAHISLFALFQEHIDLGVLELRSPVIHLVQRADGSTTLQEALGLAPSSVPISNVAAAPIAAPAILAAETAEPDPVRPLNFSGRIEIHDGEFHITGNNGSSYTLEGINLSAALVEKHHIRFSVTGSGGESSLAVKGVVHLEGTGTLLESSVNLSQVPVLQLLDALDLQGELREQVAALVGQKIDIEASARFEDLSQGVVAFDYHGTNSSFRLRGRVDSGVLLLEEDAVLQLTVTPDLSRLLLKDINPLLVTAVSAEEPLTVTVGAQGFRAPLAPFALEEIVIPSMRVDAGRVVLNNGGPVALLLGFLKAHSLQKERQLEAWFTPQYISMENGVVDVMRVDFLLASTFHLAYWGEVDLINDRLRMELGVSRSALRNAFGISAGSQGEMVVFSLRGRPSRPDLDFGRSATQIAALVAQEQTGDVGKVLGAVMDKTNLNPFSSHVPSPTTQPFPWGSVESAPEVEPSPPPSSAPSPLEKPAKELERSLKKALKNLF